MAAQPLRFVADLQNFTVTDTSTGDVYQCREMFETATLRRNLELKHQRPAVTSPRKQRRLDQQRQSRQGGMGR